MSTMKTVWMTGAVIVMLVFVVVSGAREGEGERKTQTAETKSILRRTERVPMPWTLPNPDLTIKQGRIKVVLTAETRVKGAKFYMSINHDFTAFKQADHKIKLKCKRKVCKSQGKKGPIINVGDVVYYGMKAKTASGLQAFLGRKWQPFPSVSTTTTVTTTTTSNVPNGQFCGEGLDGALPEGCSSVMFTVPTSLPTDSTTRGNPDRGFYGHTETKTSNWVPVDAGVLQFWVGKGYTLIYRNFILDTFINSNISEDVLQKIREDFVTVKENGMKVIVRFCYSINQTQIDDAPPAQLQAHIQQLEPILQEHVGVISVMHAGFIGVWGEWYYTSNYGNEGVISEEDWQKRSQVVTDLLLALPLSRQIQLRTPRYKQEILGRDIAISSAEAHTNAQVARIGHHNDCFLASNSDYGTYVNKDVEYPFLQNETLYLTQGGETCNVNPPRSDCPTALKELEELHYTYLNSAYHPSVLQSWEDQGCLETVRWSMGYRLVGVEARLPEEVSVGNTVSVGVFVRNIGWAAPINPRSAQLVVEHEVSGQEFKSPLTADDLWKWLPGDHSLSLSLDLPADAPLGVYKVLLVLPDGDPSLEDVAEYNIVMENLADASRRNLLGTMTVV